MRLLPILHRVPCTRSDRLLARPLTLLVAAFALLVVLTWLPGYLTWPMWADHDVFATLALEWSHGQLPYRDRPTTNFPGPIYQAWVMGHLFGWGNVQAIYAFDAMLTLTLAGSCIAWSRRNLGTYLPGIVAVAVLVSYHATHDFTQAAQRDGQATAFVLLAILAVAGRDRPRWSIVASAALVAFAMVSRPQAVLFLPALFAALWPTGKVRLIVKWIACFTGFVALLFLPLFANGIFGDFLREIGRIGDGGIYRGANPSLHLEQALTGGFLVFVALSRFRTLWPVLALLGAWFYRPLSPYPHAYLEQPFRATLAVAAMYAVACWLKSPTPLRQIAIPILIGCLIPVPRFCEVQHIGRVWRALGGHPSPSYGPKGYVTESISGLGTYPYRTYSRVLEYLRNQSPETPVANLLLIPTAINGPAARRTPLHAESMTWLTVVGRDDAARFGQELRDCPNALVVWRPCEWEIVPQWACLPAVVGECYEPLAKFDDLEIWRRK